MNCPYCYIPFVDPSPGTLQTWQSIVDRMADFSPDLVTFGGGDPLAHHGFIQLLDYCKKYSFKIHVDTNCIALNTKMLPCIKERVDMLGIPLDGEEYYHNRARNHPKHYKIITASLEKLSEYNIPTKINTVYFPNHEEQLYHIADLIRKYENIKQWFIYEYWHFENINSPQTFDYDSIAFEKTIEDLKKRSNVEKICFSPVSERVSAYLFVSSCGALYTVDSKGDKYIELGNILNMSNEEIPALVTNLEKISNRARLKI